MVEVNSDMKRIIQDLQVVKSHGEFPKGRNYLFSRYKHEGLVIMGNMKKVREGGKTNYYLTPNSKVKLTKKGHAIVKLADRNNQFL